MRGPGEEERQSLIKRTKNLWDDLMHGRDYDKELMIEYHDELAKDVAREKKRIGGVLVTLNCHKYQETMALSCRDAELQSL